MSEQRQTERMRIFCAVELPEDVRAHAAAHIARLRDAADRQLKIGWERTEKLHLTLKFLGGLEQTRVEALTRAAERAAESVGKFEVSLRQAGAFPAGGHPRVLWLGLHDDEGLLAQLHARLEAECARENFPLEARPFHPHVTIARIRTPNSSARHVAQIHRETNFAPLDFTVNELVVMHSQLGAGGSRYTPLSRHELKK